jgi:hypothetical protein
MKGKKDFATLAQAWQLAITTIAQHQQIVNSSESLGQLFCKQAVTIKPGESKCIDTVARVKNTVVASVVVVDDEDIAVPGGLVMTPAVVRLHSDRVSPLETVTLFNPSGKSVTVAAATPIASVAFAGVIHEDLE